MSWRREEEGRRGKEKEGGWGEGSEREVRSGGRGKGRRKWLSIPDCMREILFHRRDDTNTNHSIIQ